jgi:hypothetical protein
MCSKRGARLAAVGARDFACDREPQSRAVGARGGERLEQPLPNVRGHARPGIADAKAKRAVARRRSHSHDPTRRRILHSIEQQIVQGAANLIDIELCGRDSSWNGHDLQADAFGGGKLAMRFARLLEEAPEVGFGRLRLMALRHGQQVAQQAIESPDLLQDRLQRRHSTIFVARDNRVLGLEPHGCNGIANFMREAGGQSADGREPLGGAGAAALLADPLAGGVERLNQPVELALAGEGQGGKVAGLVDAGRK